MAHKSEQELAGMMYEAGKLVEVAGQYFHYKNPAKLYKVLKLGILEETEEVCVVYEALYGEHLTWVRPLSVWLSKVQTPDGEVPRFQEAE